MGLQAIGGTMYRRPSGEETELASAIRKHTSGPCWPRDDGSNAISGKSAKTSASAFKSVAAQTEPT